MGGGGGLFFLSLLCLTLALVVLQMYALWDVSVNDGNGKEKYGDDYADIYAINRLHFKAAMNNDCDHVSMIDRCWAWC